MGFILVVWADAGGGEWLTKEQRGFKLDGRLVGEHGADSIGRLEAVTPSRLWRAR